jgi:hypothetical protein
MILKLAFRLHPVYNIWTDAQQYTRILPGIIEIEGQHSPRNMHNIMIFLSTMFHSNLKKNILKRGVVKTKVFFMKKILVQGP